MFDTKKFFQVLGIAIINTFLISIILGLIQFNQYFLFVLIQLVVNYGTIGILSAIWLPRTPYFAAYLGAITMALLNLLFTYYILNVYVFVDAEGISTAFSWAVIIAISFAFITTAIKQKGKEAVV